jgi:hypothetical protein
VDGHGIAGCRRPPGAKRPFRDLRDPPASPVHLRRKQRGRDRSRPLRDSSLWAAAPQSVERDVKNIGPPALAADPSSQ